jgi:zinc/manganese transport system substrate-binding protein
VDAGGGKVEVVASTDVYGQIAQQIGGSFIDVTSIVDSPAQDPHSYEPSARDQLLVADADLLLENGGGYDPFMEALIQSSGSAAKVLTAAEFSEHFPGGESGDARHDGADDAHPDDHEHVEGFNEHVWYDAQAMETLAVTIAGELSDLLPAHASTFERNAEAFGTDVATLDASLRHIRDSHEGERVFATEPVSAYLLAAAGLGSVTPDAFSEAVEEGQDVPPAALLEALDLLANADVRVVIANTQTGGPETTRMLDTAGELGIPVLSFTETLPDGDTYLTWMRTNIEALSGALEA